MNLTVQRLISRLATVSLSLSLLVVSAGTARAEFLPVAIPPDHGVVYVYRPKAFVGGNVKTRLAVDGTFKAEIRTGAYLALVLPPGIHTLGVTPLGRPMFTIDPDNTPIDINIEAGKTAYVRATTTKGFGNQFEVVFQASDERDALSELHELRAVEAE